MRFQRRKKNRKHARHWENKTKAGSSETFSAGEHVRETACFTPSPRASAACEIMTPALQRRFPQEKMSGKQSAVQNRNSEQGGQRTQPFQTKIFLGTFGQRKRLGMLPFKNVPATYPASALPLLLSCPPRQCVAKPIPPLTFPFPPSTLPPSTFAPPAYPPTSPCPQRPVRSTHSPPSPYLVFSPELTQLGTPTGLTQSRNP